MHFNELPLDYNCFQYCQPKLLRELFTIQQSRLTVRLPVTVFLISRSLLISSCPAKQYSALHHAFGNILRLNSASLISTIIVDNQSVTIISLWLLYSSSLSTPI